MKAQKAKMSSYWYFSNFAHDFKDFKKLLKKLKSQYFAPSVFSTIFLKMINFHPRLAKGQNQLINCTELILGNCFMAIHSCKYLLYESFHF